jgi:hypothetical protein
MTDLVPGVLLIAAAMLVLAYFAQRIASRLRRRRTLELYEAVLLNHGENLPLEVADMVFVIRGKSLLAEMDQGRIHGTDEGHVSGAEVLAAIGHPVPPELRRPS